MLARVCAALVLFMIIGTGWLADVQPAQAASFTVDSTRDAPDAALRDGVCATAPLPNEGARCTLRAAIMEANALGGAHTITLPAGTFVLTITGPIDDLDGNPDPATGDLDIQTGLTIVGAGVLGPATIRQSSISANTAGSGGGILGRGTVVEDSIITGNRADFGGGIFSFLDPLPTIRRTTISSNRAITGGGIDGGGTIEESLISSNTAEYRGGIHVSGGASISVGNSTVSGNTATYSGGGVYLGESGCPDSPTCPTGVFRNVTVAENRAPDGSGVMATSGVNTGLPFASSIVANNQGSPNCSPLGQISSGGYNLSNDSSCRIIATGDRQNVDPRLGPLADNGGPTRTYALLADSLAVDAGPRDGCPAADQRGQSRVVDGNDDGTPRCDLGAFEAEGPAFPAFCSSRPAVATQAVPTGDGRLEVTVSLSRTSGSTNALQAITWTSLTNATVILDGGGTVSAGQQTALPAGAQSVSFLVGRVTPGQVSTVRFTVTDACGSWPTFVGGGPTAF